MRVVEYNQYTNKCSERMSEEMNEDKKKNNREKVLISKLESLSNENLTYLLLVAQALIAEQNQKEPCSED